jgi:hypothetical protein
VSPAAHSISRSPTTRSEYTCRYIRARGSIYIYIYTEHEIQGLLSVGLIICQPGRALEENEQRAAPTEDKAIFTAQPLDWIWLCTARSLLLSLA